MTNTEATAAAEILAADWIPTSRLAYFATHWNQYSDNGHGFVWELIDSTQEDAIAYYASIADRDDDYLREEAAEALAGAGWTRKAIAFKLS